ncbi:MAG: hypothetical protein MUE50_14545 [Pirellulaceae bacterium]|jgi:hypothetical protein|nr:hypothetical protein [Pirellulaceae bacterium]
MAPASGQGKADREFIRDAQRVARLNDLDLRMTEFVERGFNCIRIEGGAGITHDADGRPRRERSGSKSGMGIP